MLWIVKRDKLYKREEGEMCGELRVSFKRTKRISHLEDKKELFTNQRRLVLLCEQEIKACNQRGRMSSCGLLITS